MGEHRGADIRRLREAAKLTGEDVASVAGISKSQLSLLENGKRGMNIQVYARLLNAIVQVRDQKRCEAEQADSEWDKTLAALGMGRPALPEREEKVA